MGLVLFRSMNRRVLIVRVLLVTRVVELIVVWCGSTGLCVSVYRVRWLVRVGLLRIGLCHTNVASVALMVGKRLRGSIGGVHRDVGDWCIFSGGVVSVRAVSRDDGVEVDLRDG